MRRSFLAAVSLITCVPLGGFLPSERDLQRCSNWFPVVGLLAGCVLYYPAFYALMWFGAVGAVLIVAMLEAVSKGFHLDGLADTADAFLSSRSRERKLEIMRDSHIGTMGVAAIVLVLLGKYAVFSRLTPEQAAVSVLFCAFAGRFAVSSYLLISHYVRPQGLGALCAASVLGCACGTVCRSCRELVPDGTLLVVSAAGSVCCSLGPDLSLSDRRCDRGHDRSL